MQKPDQPDNKCQGNRVMAIASRLAPTWKRDYLWERACSR
ncbi:hypothetical protein SAMN04490206_6242 [Pseudomonas umsongensis]|nr:hypothetical protein PG5_13600 [Pseudomonas sp. G5(2012)]SDT76780.1 hypothetical protein SAMN04490206_6242 [Pseudomonas umsongensis]